MKIAILTQDDRFVIPQNIQKIVAMPGVETSLVAVLDVSSSLVNRKSVFMQGFGLVQSFRMGMRMLMAKCMDLCDAVLGYRLLRKKRSIKAVAACNGIPFMRINNPNESAFCRRMKDLGIDLVVSLSAPCKFKPELLTIPRCGCINLHCSLLPRYAGLMPSFWVLYHGERIAGATVHYMDSEIDNGAILAQSQVPVDPGMTMFELIQRTKKCGGELLIDVIRKIQEGNATSLPNDAADRSYYSWPTIEQMKEFRKRGGRLI